MVTAIGRTAEDRGVALLDAWLLSRVGRVVIWLLDCMASIRSQRKGFGDDDWSGAVDSSMAKDRQPDSVSWGGSA